MALPRRSWYLLWSAGLGLSLAAGCNGGPSYRQDQVAEAIRQICTDEHHLQVTVRQAGQTLAVHLHHPGILQQTANQIGLSPSANEVLGNVIEAMHRVVLSSDSPTRFYVLVASDPTVPQAYLTLVRYVDDVRRVNANIIPPTEFFSRTLLELKALQPPGANMDQMILHDIPLEEFLSKQLTNRIQARLAARVDGQDLSTVTVGPCGGEFHDGEFAFTLNVMPKPGLPFDDALLQQIFEDATNVIAQVLSSYRFDQFEAIRLIHPSTGRNLLLGKTQLQLFR